jgi:hypothetical protein
MLIGSLVCVWLAAPAAANYYEFTGTISIAASSPRFLPKGAIASGSGIGVSGVLPKNEIVQLAGVKGFSGSLATTFVSGANYTRQASISAIGAANFAKALPGNLHGVLAAGGLAQRFVGGVATGAFALTSQRTAGLGLGGTLPQLSGTSTVNVRFDTWTTGTAIEAGVVTQSLPAKGIIVIGNLVGMGSDNRTSRGMGTVQLVSPIRTVGLLGLPGDRAAIAKLSLTFAPEPGRAALLFAGCAALSLLGVAQKRSAKNSLD